MLISAIQCKSVQCNKNAIQINILQKNVSMNFFQTRNYVGKRSIGLRVKSSLTVTYSDFTIKYQQCPIFKEEGFSIRKTDATLCLFCNIDVEISLHHFHKCSATKKLWKQLIFCVQLILAFPF